jgi:hypothetical protein
MSHCKRSEELCGILSGLQQNPPVYAVNAQPASGKVYAELKGNKLIVTGKFKNLSSPLQPVGTVGAAHIHFGAPGTNGQVVFELTPTLKSDGRSGYFDACQNRFPITDEQKEAFRAGNYYVNIHTQTYPNGEIRAQLLPKVKYCRQYIVILSGSNQVPPVTATSARGTILATYNCGKLVLNGTFSGLVGDLLPVAGSAGHIHLGAAGVTGPIRFPLTITPIAATPTDTHSGALLRVNNKFSLTSEDKQTLNDSGFYINIHTTAYPSGEIRGQIVPLY